GFTAVTIAACSAQIKYVEGGPRSDDKHETLLRLVADRTGIISKIIMPLLILFAGRNNFLQWLTRWDFATFIAFHRWVARVVFILVFIHSIANTAAYLMSGRYYTRMQNNFMIWGTIATVASGIITFQGMLYFRRKWYEMFLIIHIIMAALFIGGAWVHVDELGYVWFYYATVAVWVFDRVVRIGRLVVFGCPKSEVILLADETLKVIVPKPSYWKSVPGGHAFIHFMRPSCFWQSHPFTFTSSEEQDKIVLYCKVKGGVTHGLYQYLATHPGRTTQIRVALEGPYGEPTAAKRYDSAVFVAGGNGIPGIYSEIHDLAVRSKSNIKQSLKLVWVVREYRSLYWFYEEILALKNTKINTTIYITKPESQAYVEEFNHRIPLITNESDSDADIAVEKKHEKIEDNYSFKEKDSSGDSSSEEPVDKNRIIEIVKSELSHVTFKEGRPSMEEMVLQVIDESNGSVAFVTCGHPVMVDDLRHSVVSNLDNTKNERVEFFEQLQVWA
ncbi:MAG: ferric reductase-like transmembrane domain-containing protein, partial [Tetragenococcus koreensis]|nr:ferric reductase-like transmembrane domain-containing protein [Tetragenococcus koreensis]